MHLCVCRSSTCYMHGLSSDVDHQIPLFRCTSYTHLWDGNTRRGVISRTERDARHSSLTRHMRACTWRHWLDASTHYPKWVPFRIRRKNNGLDDHHKMNTGVASCHKRDIPIRTRSQLSGRNDQRYRNRLSKSHSMSISSSNMSATSSSPSAILRNTSKCECQHAISPGFALGWIRCKHH
jgi:hypothetical protein